MNEPLYRVKMRDGREFENLTKDEVLPWLCGKNETEWASVTPMEYAKECDPENAKRRKAWGM